MTEEATIQLYKGENVTKILSMLSTEFETEDALQVAADMLMASAYLARQAGLSFGTYLELVNEQNLALKTMGPPNE